MLGSAFRTYLAAAGPRLVDRAELAAAGAEAILSETRPDLVINCAAHTDVEGAERDSEAAYAANAELPGRIARACATMGAVLVHFSSTGVYGRWKDEPYAEDDRAEPTTVHHKSKLAGEEAVAAAAREHLIVRTGWLFGGAPGAAKNFVWKRLIEASSSERMVSDPFQSGCPTFVDDVAEQVMVAVAAGVRGLVNVVAQGRTSRFGYVERIVRASGLPCHVEPASAPFQRLAQVSPNEAAVNARLQALGLDCMPSWEEAVDRYVQDLVAAPDWTARKQPA